MRSKISFSQHSKERLAESARYALLRRLAPALRHNLAGALQPLRMMALLIGKRLEKSDLDIGALGKNTDQLTMATRDASDACMNMMTWLTPSASKFTTVAAGVEDAAGLVLMELSIKGFTVINNINDLQTLIPVSLTRNSFMAALLSLTDASQAPAKVTLNGEANGNELLLSISVQPVEGVPPLNETPPYRNLDWEDVVALAEADTVVLSRSTNFVQLAFVVQPSGN